MLRKQFSLLMLFFISGCQFFGMQNDPVPAEFAGADYLLSDKDAERWAMASNQVEQCIYPTLTRIQQAHFAKEDAYVHSQYVLFYPLEDIIGEDYVKIIQNDEKSMNYAQRQFKKFKHLKADPLPTQQCELLRQKARDDLAVVKGQYKSGMLEEKTENAPTGGKGVATDQNKFFFDIIKWGAAFLL